MIEQNLIPLRDLCKTYHVDNLFLFGSAATNKFKKESDFDFLVNFSSELDLMNYADNYFDFMSELQQLFGREIIWLQKNHLKTLFLSRK